MPTTTSNGIVYPDAGDAPRRQDLEDLAVSVDGAIGTTGTVASRVLGATDDLVVWDHFDGTGELDVAPSGQSWVRVSTDGVIEKVDGRAKSTSGGPGYVVDAGLADVVLGCDVRWNTGSDYTTVLAKWVDTDNHLRLRRSSSGIQLAQNLGGALSAFINVVFADVSPTVEKLAISRTQLIMVDDRVMLLVDGGFVGQATLSSAAMTAFGASTLYGLSSSLTSPGGFWDNFYVRRTQE